MTWKNKPANEVRKHVCFTGRVHMVLPYWVLCHCKSHETTHYSTEKLHPHAPAALESPLSGFLNDSCTLSNPGLRIDCLSAWSTLLSLTFWFPSFIWSTLFSFNSQFSRNHSQDLLDSVIPPHVWLSFLGISMLPPLVWACKVPSVARILSVMFTDVNKEIGVWSSLIKFGGNEQSVLFMFIQCKREYLGKEEKIKTKLTFHYI